MEVVIFRYSIGYESARELQKLARNDAEHAAITRLEDFRGEAADVELAAQLYDAAGKRAVARWLRGWLD